MDLTFNIKCKVCGSEESTSIDEFRLHGINHCIPSIARYFGVHELDNLSYLMPTLHQQMQYQRYMEDQQQQQDILKKRKIDHNNNNNHHPLPLPTPPPLPNIVTTFNTINSQSPNTTLTSTLTSSLTSPFTLTTMTVRFKSLIGSQFIRQTIFKHVKELNNKKIDGNYKSLSGIEIIDLPRLGMISLYGMPWEFIKHYLPPLEEVLLKRRWNVISRYCSHRNATLSTLQQLLEWSPDYDPQDQYESVHQNLFYDISSQGHTDILKYLLKIYPNIKTNGNRNAITVASEWGQLSTVQLLSQMKGVKCNTDAMDKAAENGHLDVVMYLDQNRTEGCTHKAMDKAAENGHLDVVRYLEFHRTEGCSTNAMDKSAENGHYDVVLWLHHNRTGNGKCTERAMDNASKNGHFDIVQWLHHNRSEGCSEMAMNNASMNGYFDIVQWLHKYRREGCTSHAMDRTKTLKIFQFLGKHGKMCTPKQWTMHFLCNNRTEGCTQQAVINACNSGNFELVKYILANLNVECPSTAVDSAIQKNFSLDMISYLDKPCTLKGLECAIKNARLDVIQYFHKKYSKSNVLWNRDVLNMASEYGHLDIVKFLHENRTEGCTTKAMDEAACNGHIEIVKFLHFNRTEGCTTDAMDFATMNGQTVEMIKWLHFNRTEGCTSMAMCHAALGDDWDSVEFLQQHRTEGCHEDIIWDSRFHDIREYIISNKLISMESIKQGRIKQMQFKDEDSDDYYEMIDLINKYYGI
ncbi:hypothetical protein DFA_04121 [Cavenderia fasciculata]|uniref:Ankyrin repeat-containing protein n=1 Tax=Cavenderia fasciculata TaxID=261658 RepID=F4Q1C5_CACFS|nr:uncharacterized protein DFA_04121 [Cavenderia fasciculata]EGG18626.1 hypothetical protein DFA_04121 [Cavenderia fasciculata]|eukprot:XP_004366530.1 hypothetical protein DFA_04121 [Cavenderia fasciculata]